jgi:hypothetical protein
VQRQCFVALAELACSLLEERMSIPATEILAWRLLDDEQIFPRGAKEVLTAPVVELGRAFIALVSGTLPQPPNFTAWVHADTGRGTIPMRVPCWPA